MWTELKEHRYWAAEVIFNEVRCKGEVCFQHTKESCIPTAREQSSLQRSSFLITTRFTKCWDLTAHLIMYSAHCWRDFRTVFLISFYSATNAAGRLCRTKHSTGIFDYTPLWVSPRYALEIEWKKGIFSLPFRPNRGLKWQCITKFSCFVTASYYLEHGYFCH